MLLNLGMPTLLELPNLDATVRLCRELQLSFIELHQNLPDYLPGKLAPERLRALATENGIQFTLHLPEELDLASLHPPIRAGYLRYCKQTLEWAAKAGIGLVNLHLNPGVWFTTPERKAWIYDRYYVQFYANLKESVSALLGIVRDNGMKFCFENTGHYGLAFLDAALQQLTLLDGVYLTWDVGHDAKSGFMDQPILFRHKQRVAHLHLHDFDGESDHLPLGSGTLDWPTLLEFAADQEASVVLEVKTVADLEDSVRKVAELKGRPVAFRSRA